MENTNIDQFEKHKTIAVFISPNICDNLKDTFDKFIKNDKAGLYIYQNYIKKATPIIDKKITLENIIATCTYIALSKENIGHAIRTYREYRRIYKRNWLATIKEEIESPENMRPKNPQSLREYATSLDLIAKLERSDSQKMTIQDIMIEKYNDIEKWRSDTSALITDFFFLGNKSIKSIANGFINDITLESLIIIDNTFGGSIEGFNVKYPTELAEHPVFSYRSTQLNFEPTLVENELLFFHHYSLDKENTEEDITVQYNPGVNLPSTDSIKAMPKLLKKYDVQLTQRELDMRDRDIITQLFNLINGETLSSKYITCDLREFTKKIMNTNRPQKRHYDEICSRLQKIKSYDYTITIREKESSDIVETISMGLLNYLLINRQDNPPFFQFTPSEQWTQTYVQKKYINILTNAYKSVDSPQTKGIMMILQKERLTQHNNSSLDITLTLKYFRSHMKLQRIGNAALIKELTKHLSALKKEQIVVQDFHLVNKNSSIHINFMPLNNNELLAYGFSTKNIIDAPSFKCIEKTVSQ